VLDAEPLEEKGLRERENFVQKKKKDKK